MTSEKSNYLESVDIFQDLPAGKLDAIGHRTHLVTHPPNHLFFMPNEPGEVLFILKKGRVQLYRLSSEGRKLVVAVLHPGAIFGHMAIVGQRLHNTYAESLDQCMICVWYREDVEHLLMEQPRVAIRFLEALGERLAQAEQHLSEITFKRVPARLAGLLLRLDKEAGCTGLLEGYTHQYLADMLGIYRETATQILNDFKQQNLIVLGRKKIEIQDARGLAHIAAE